MADFTNNQIKNTYQRVLQHDLSGVVQNGMNNLIFCLIKNMKKIKIVKRIKQIKKVNH